MFSWKILPAGIKAVFFVQIVNRMGDFVVPFLTLILTQVQGLSPAVSGLVVSLATALGSLGGLWAGKLGDRHSRRDVLTAFLATSAVLVAGVGFAPREQVCAAVLVAAGFFFGAMRPLLGALVGDLSTPDTRRSAFSLSYLGINLGVSAGPLLAGWLFHNALGWLFWLDALSTLAALGILLRWVPRKTHKTETEAAPPVRSALSAFVRHPVLFPFSLLLLVYDVVYAQMVFTLALELVDLFAAKGPQTYGLVWAVNAVVVIVLTPLILRFTRKWTNLASMARGMGLFALGTAVFLLHPDLLWVLASTLLWSAGEVLFSVHYGDLVTSHSPPEMRARFQAYSGFLGSLGFVVSPVLSGLVAQALGLQGVWWMATALVTVVGVGFAVLDRVSRESRVPVEGGAP